MSEYLYVQSVYDAAEKKLLFVTVYLYILSSCNPYSALPSINYVEARR